MKTKLLSLLVCLLLGTTALHADLPFRNHRYSAFTPLQVKPDNIVFVGNSITNMHEWWEAFDNPAIINRGVSGAVSDELLANLECVLAGHPAKVFLMIGTNDLGTAGINNPQHVAANLRTILGRFAAESPETQVYVQSILPCSKDETLLLTTNDSIRNICGRFGVSYIDLWDDLYGVRNSVNSLDRLHLLASGYRIWCKKIAPLVGSDCVYEDTYENLTGGLSGSYAMRCSYFGMLPVKADDVLFIGDGAIHGAEWHELLHCDKIKNRGTGWGYPGSTIADVTKEISPMLTGNGNKVAPAKILLYVGASELNGSTALSDILTSYSALIAEIRTYAPTTPIYINSLLPTNNATTNSTRVVPFNTMLQELAAADATLEFIDTYTAMAANGVANTNYFSGNYVYGRGYAKWAQVLAPYLSEEGATALSDTEAEAIINMHTTRMQLMSAVVSAGTVEFGTGTGQYPLSQQATLEAALTAADNALATSGVTTGELTAQAEAITQAIEAIKPTINLPAASTDGDEHWYQFYTPQRGNYYLSSTGAGEGIIGEAANNFARSMWKLETRTDGSFDIINRADGSYLNPSASYNTQISTSTASPSAGWTLSYSDTPGLYIISSGRVQLNQTSINAKVYNWSANQTGADRSDNGCQYAIILTTEEPAVEPDPLDEGWYRLQVESSNIAAITGYIEAGTNAVLNAENEYRQNASNYYALKFAAADAAKPATAWVHLTKVGSNFRFQALNGHTINENCTSSRDQTQAPATITANGTLIAIDKWSNYANDGAESPYIGKSSSSNNLYSYSLVKAAELAAYDHYTVSITGATAASEVGLDASVTCTHSANQGIAKVFDHGHYFFPKGTAVTAANFTVNTTESTETSVAIVGDTIYVYFGGEHPVAALVEEANALLARTGVGLPRTESQARADLEAAVATATAGPDNPATAVPLREAINTYCASTDIELPAAGKAYTLTNVQQDGTTYALYAAEDGTLTVGAANVPASSYGPAAVFVCGENGSSRYFAIGTGHYLAWCGLGAGINDDKGYTPDYSATHSLFTIGSGNAGEFGTVYLSGKRSNANNAGSLILSSAGEFNGWGNSMAWAAGYSNLFRMEEAGYPNTVTTQASTDFGRVGTFSAPFPTVVPEGTTAYSAVSNGYAVGLTAIEGDIVPANTGVVLCGTAADYTMVPATAAGTAPAQNELLPAGLSGYTPAATDNAYVLSATAGDALFAPTATTVAPGTAYLLLTGGTQASLPILPGSLTGIASGLIPAAAQPLHDLSGRRVNAAGRGIYIQAGRKILVK